MLHLKKNPSTSWLTAFSVSLFYNTAALLLLTHSCGGQVQVVGPLQPVIVTVGDDITLPCQLKPAVDAAGMTIEWARPDLNPRFVHVWHERQELQVNQHPSFKGRTSVSVNNLKHGDVSLNLSKVKLSDRGTYRCYFPDLDKDATVQLVVGTASSPIIRLSGIDRSSSGVVLQCESAGWYPEPEVLWLDGEGNLLSAGPTETVRGPDDLYTVSSRVTVEKRHSNSFTCRVQQKDTNQMRETHMHLTDDFFMAACSSAACITVSVVACFTCILAVGFAGWRWRRDRIKTEMISKEEKQQLIAQSKKMAERAEDLQRKEEDMVGRLKQQKEELKNQKDKLKQHHKKVEELLEESENKLQTVEKDSKDKEEHKGFISSPKYSELKGIINQYKWVLTEELEKLGRLELDTDKLLVETDGEIVRMTEKKNEAEKHEE